MLKALALGARAVMIGRPILWGLAVAGADLEARGRGLMLLRPIDSENTDPDAMHREWA